MAAAKKSLTVFIFAVLGVLFVVFITPKIIQIRSLQKRSENLEEENTRLKAQDAALESELRLLRDDPVYLEKVAREKFNKAKEGEIVYKVVRETDTSAAKADHR